MAANKIISAFALASLVATCALAEDGQNHRPEARRAPAQQGHVHQQARPRASAPRVEPRREERVQAPHQDVRREQARPEVRTYDRGRATAAPRAYAAPRYESHRGYVAPRYNGRVEAGRPYAVGRAYIAPRVIAPRFEEVVPYRPYVYRPSWSIGVYYGANGYYPYGSTPDSYFNPIPGHYYGGLRITGLPRDAQVFADGYYVGIVDNFDGIFQHLNLEAGPHHIEIREPAVQPVAFDITIVPGRTMTFRGEPYMFQP
jgi:hypothetical protein